MKNFKVGEIVQWASRIGTVRCEYRGKVMGMDGWEACIIVREDNGPCYQTMVPLSQLSATAK